MVRIPACHAGGRGFESRPLRQPYNLAVPSFRAFSSVGRASALQAECRRFDSVNAHHRFTVGAVVQLVRIPACHAGGRGFESRPLRQPYNLAVPSFRAFSSVGRASALQAECRRFDSVNAHHRFTVGAVVQLVRIPACHAGGRGFESRPLRQPYNLVVPSFRAFSSVGRASALQAECRRFDSVNAHHRFTVGAVVQLVRIPACHAGGRGFESRPLRQRIKSLPLGRLFSFQPYPTTKRCA